MGVCSQLLTLIELLLTTITALDIFVELLRIMLTALQDPIGCAHLLAVLDIISSAASWRNYSDATYLHVTEVFTALLIFVRVCQTCSLQLKETFTCEQHNLQLFQNISTAATHVNSSSNTFLFVKRVLTVR